MTKTKDPRPLSKMLDLVTDENKHNLLDETPKRCDECRWWELATKFYGFCNNKKVNVALWAGKIAPPPDFYCKYWEKKEDDDDENK